MKELYLPNRGKNIILDDEDFERISKFKWYASNRGHISRTVNVPRSYGFGRRTFHISIANEIMLTRDIKYDHIDRNSFNNQKNNLRCCTASQNNMNTIKRKGCKSVFKGLAWNRRNRAWSVNVSKDGKRYYVGIFKDEIKAAKAYDAKALELHGEFANLNFK